MNFKIIKCWLTRHHWLLQKKTWYSGRTWGYRYQCQVCGKILDQEVIDLDQFDGEEK